MLRFQDRWEKIKENVIKNSKLLTDFDITVNKLIKQGENIKKHEREVTELEQEPALND